MQATDSDEFDVEAMRIPSSSSEPAAPITRRSKGRFLKGPIPFDWLAMAARQPGKALHVAIAVWFLSGLTRSSTVHLAPSIPRQLGLSRYAAYRGLRALERSGLVGVQRQRGRGPMVSIVDVRTDGDPVRSGA